MNDAIATARSLLFVPANRPDRYAKAAASGADAVIVDLEDSIPVAEKDSARQSLVDGWSGAAGSGVPVLVRINALGSAFGEPDVQALAPLRGLAGILVSKAEDPDAVAALARTIPTAWIVPMIESVAGLRLIDTLARLPRVSRFAVGTIDFMADTGIQAGPEEAELAPLRFAVSVATRHGGLAPAIDGITTQTEDVQRVREDTLRAKRFGFGGKLCIHPRQVAAVHAAFAPSEEELAWARRVVEADSAAQGRAVQVDGRMVDIPVVELARRLLARAGKI